MQTNVIRSRPRSGIGNRTDAPRLDKRAPLYISGSLPAERKRVFYALTMPEYMEAWLAVPGVSPGCICVRARNGSFSICWVADGTPFTIGCNYRVCNRSKLLFDWKHDTNSSITASLITIRLMGEFERTDLELIHFGLDPSVQEWHRKLWQASFAQLSRLF